MTTIQISATPSPERPLAAAEQTPGRLPSSIMWHGTALRGADVASAVAAVSAGLAASGISDRSVVVLEPDDSGRTMLAFLALANLGASIVLTSTVSRLTTFANETLTATHTIVLRDASVDEIDARTLMRDIERADGPRVSGSPPDLSGWLSRRRALAVLSSGTTTGEPALIWKDGAELVDNAVATAMALGYERHDAMLPLLPLAGQYGSSVMVIAVVVGASIVFCARTKMTEIIRTIDRADVTAVDAAPLVYRRLLDELLRHPERRDLLRRVRVFGVGGEGVTAQLADDMSEHLARPLVNGYGLAQVGNVGFCDGNASGGFRLIAGLRARIIDDTGAVAGDGELGHVQIARTRDEMPGGGQDASWISTGDLGSLRADRLVIAGREGSVNRNGTIVHLAWVERRLTEAGIPASVLAESDHRYAVIIADPIRRPVVAWRRRIDRVLGHGLVPDRVLVLGQLPLDASGKTSRLRLGRFTTALGAMREERRAAPITTAGRLRACAAAARHELIAMITEVSDAATAIRDLRAMLVALEHAEAELALHGTPAALPVDVFMTRNALLESFAVYCLIPSLWSSDVVVRPANGTEPIVNRLIELFAHANGARVSLDDSSQDAFVQTIAQRPSVVLFTGRRSNAESVLRRLGRNHLFMFFGRGVNPVVIGRDADVHDAVRETVKARLYNGGQDCLAPDLVLVHEELADDVVTQMRDAVEAHLAANGGELAPLATDATLVSAVRYLLENAQGIEHGGGIDYLRRRVEPSIVRVSGAQAAEPVEHFAPIISLATFADDAEVHALLNSDWHRENGFGMSLYGWDEQRAHLLSDHFMVAVDQSIAEAVGPFEPFGGFGAESGFIAENGARRLGPINITQTVAHSRLGTRRAGR